ncbi:serine/threonine protein kinase [Loa loa]|uniref:non-specific serine/threonine protein kinase n=1 Tax=Loa loa TaxID=7209 RepID=A0A1S0UP81_LOALO|nr:serine/threonine protein kinase [Loa loa]EJD76684.1 serine/threonine protein kinase [Loa loa]
MAINSQTNATQISTQISQNIPVCLARLYPKLKKRNTTVPLFKIGDIVAERWIISGLIGRGGYGQIFFAVDSRGEEVKGVAIKTELKMRKGRVAKRMILEQKGIAGLRDIHSIGYIHRDIKPHNLCFGLSEVSKHRLVIIDYGLARRFRYPNGRVRPLRRECGFRGTTLYASLRAHGGKDLGPSDDLVSLFYVAIEMVLGRVPWKQARRSEEVKALKEAIQGEDFQSVTEKVGESLREFGRAVHSMDAYDEPNYVALQNIMLDFTNHRQLSDPYDWDNDFEEVLRENDINQMISKNQ